MTVFGLPGAAAPLPGGTTRRDVRAGLLTVPLVAALGVPVGLLWAALAPREDIRIGGDGAVAFVGAGGDLFVGADLLYALLASVTGVAAGAVAHTLAARRGWPVAVGLVVGGTAAALVAVLLGQALGDSSLHYAGGQLRPVGGGPPPGPGVVEVALRLRATAAVVLLPLSAVLAHLVLQLLRPLPEHRKPRR